MSRESLFPFLPAALAAVTGVLTAGIVVAHQPDYPATVVVYQVVMFGAALLAAEQQGRVITRHAGTRQTEVQALCRWQGRNRGRTQEKMGGEKGGSEKGRNSHGEEGDGEEIGSREGGEENGPGKADRRGRKLRLSREESESRSRFGGVFFNLWTAISPTMYLSNT
jgi:hypothetical protein